MRGSFPLFLCLLAFLVTFVATRVITRLIRAGKGPSRTTCRRAACTCTTPSPGLILLIIGAFLSLWVGSESPWAEAAAILVGIGTSLVLDEFALILHLDDVYWSQEGRISVEMVSLCVVVSASCSSAPAPSTSGRTTARLSVGARVAAVAQPSRSMCSASS